jgi:hypothetical protein
MYTSILMVALSLAPSADLTAPSWSTDYFAASKQSARAKKPLAVFLGSGEAGYEQLDRDGKLTDEAKGLLASKYVCVYVNTDTPQGKRLAKAFEMPNGRGIVISDRTGDVQAFRHEGDLSGRELVRNLEWYADTDREVRVTETNPGQRSSNYAPTTPAPAAAPAYVAPAYYPNFNPGFYPSCSRGH